MLCGAVLSHSVVSDSLRPHGLQPARLLRPWGFSRQGYWSGLPFPSPEDLSDPGVESRSPALWVDSLPLSYPGSPHRHAETQLRLNWVSYILCGHARMLDIGFES